MQEEGIGTAQGQGIQRHRLLQHHRNDGPQEQDDGCGHGVRPGEGPALALYLCDGLVCILYLD